MSTTAARNLSTITSTAAAGVKTVTILGSAAVAPNTPTQPGDGLLFIDVAGAAIDAAGAPAGFGILSQAALSTSIFLSIGRRVADSLDPGRGVTVTQSTSGRNVLGIAAFSGVSQGDPVSGNVNGVSPATTVNVATTTPTAGAWTPPAGFNGRIVTICAFKPSLAPASATVTAGNTLLGPITWVGSGTNWLGLAVCMTDADVTVYTPPTFSISDGTAAMSVTALIQAVALAPSTTTSVFRPRTDGAVTGAVTLVPALTVPGAQPMSMLLSDVDVTSMVKLAAAASVTVTIDTPPSKAMTFEADLICQDGAASTTWLLEALEATTVRASWTDTVTSTTTVTTVSHALTTAQQATFGTGAVGMRVTASAVA